MTEANRQFFEKTINRVLAALGLVFCILLALASLTPLYWMLTGSLKIQIGLVKFPPELFPLQPTLENWRELFRAPLTLRWLANSFVVAGGISLFSVVTSTSAGYAFGKKKFPGSTWLFWPVIMTMMLPRQIFLVPLFILMRQFNWIDTYQALIIPFICYPFGIFLMRQYMQSIPNELLEAATLDGASELQLFAKIVLPLAAPAVGAIAIFAFMEGWNDYLWQLVMVNKDSMLTLPVAVSKMLAVDRIQTNLGLGMAGATLAFLPMLVIFVLLQRALVKGIAVGSLRG